MTREILGWDLWQWAVVGYGVFLLAAIGVLILIHWRALQRERAASEGEVVRFPPRLRVVQDAVDAAGDQADATIFDWPGRVA
jgi:hypothetical protein